MTTAKSTIAAAIISMRRGTSDALPARWASSPPLIAAPSRFMRTDARGEFDTHERIARTAHGLLVGDQQQIGWQTQKRHGGNSEGVHARSLRRSFEGATRQQVEILLRREKRMAH